MDEQRNVTFFHSADAGKTWTVTEYGAAGLFHKASLAFQGAHGIAGACPTPRHSFFQLLASANKTM